MIIGWDLGLLEDSIGDIYWFITDRDWAGMAIAPEFIRVSVGGKIELTDRKEDQHRVYSKQVLMVKYHSLYAIG